MTNEPNVRSHAGCCMGHCRAQRFAMDSHCAAAFEKEKATIKAYEDGWDNWDGPIWPWRETNKPQAQQKLEDEYQGCCSTPEQTTINTCESNISTQPSTMTDLSIALANVHQLKPSADSSRPSRPASLGGSVSSSSSLWSSRTTSPCPTCGRGATSHL
ncbi:uncharacterized protein BDZ99DRAFT_162085 [Mytilinidion resinicola]|uniref:Uncharacterized protein n=1 Tax=Mytilinidion resinicola TaxID=574789 RepID=A0A6A6Y6V9_9PEZI|nr:uncharacterized protein BDZ99DRAFT_162085 [Mytilinidion resinicola]KAF2803754.1 hypothetical protein BDZ99DRAFT_162085 [Mytilinidion resinicola]